MILIFINADRTSQSSENNESCPTPHLGLYRSLSGEQSSQRAHTHAPTYTSNEDVYVIGPIGLVTAETKLSDAWMHISNNSPTTYIHTPHHTFHPRGLSINNGWKDDTRVGVRVATGPGPVFLQTPRQYYNSASCSVILSTPLVESMTLYCPPLATSSDGRRR